MPADNPKRVLRLSKDVLARELDLVVEALETRRLLAGEVTLQVSTQGDITLIGDQQPNELFISTILNDLRIEGLNGTTVVLNGVSAMFQDVDLGADQVVDRDLRLRMSGGNDTVSLVDVVIARHLTIDMGRGDDLLDVLQGEVNGRTRLLGGGGAFRDVIFVTSILDGPVFVSSGPNRDGLSDEIQFVNAIVNSQLTIRGGSQGDFVYFEGADLTGTTDVNTGSGDDLVLFFSMTVDSQVKVATGGGDDSVKVDSSSVTGTVDCRLGSGNDDLLLVVATISGDLQVNGNGGLDRLLTNQVTLMSPVNTMSVEEVQVL